MTRAPGSWNAVFNHGCKCDMIQNQFGLGVTSWPSPNSWAINPDCPLHFMGYEEPRHTPSRHQGRRPGVKFSVGSVLWLS